MRRILLAATALLPMAAHAQSSPGSHVMSMGAIVDHPAARHAGFGGRAQQPRAMVPHAIPTGPLDLARFSYIKGTDFSKMSSAADLIAGGWPVINGGQYLWFSKQAATGLGFYVPQASSSIQATIEESNQGATQGHGYGLYINTSQVANAGQAAGFCDLLWPANNQWVTDPNAKLGEAREMDQSEVWDKSSGHFFSTIHWKDGTPGGGQQIHQINLDVTKPFTTATDWEPGYIAFYAGPGTSAQGLALQYVDTQHSPRDAADGGTNFTMGAGIIRPQGPAGEYLQAAAYYAPGAGAAAPAPAPSQPPASTPPPPPASPPPTTPTLSIGTPIFSASNMLLPVTKHTGVNQTLRWSLDGKYQGTLWDGMPDQTHTFSLPLPQPAGQTHTELLTLDGSTVTAQASEMVPAGAAPAPSYTLAQLQADVTAVMSKGGTAASMATAIADDFARYEAANPGK